MKSIRPRPPQSIAAAVLIAAGLTAQAPEAYAELRICNQTLNLYNVSVGYFTGSGCHDPNDPDRSRCYLQTEGWWNLPANGCTTLIKWELDNPFYYIFATDIYGEDAVSGETELCVNLNRKFEIQIPFSDAAAKTPGCWQKGHQQVKFREIDTGGTNDWTVFVGE